MFPALTLEQIPAQADTSTDQHISMVVDVFMRTCVAGGTKFSVRGTADGGADIKLKSLGAAGGRLAASVEIEKSDIEGLIAGLDGAMNQVTADQADKVRECLKPQRQRLLDYLLPPKRKPATPAPAAPSQPNVSGNCNFLGGTNSGNNCGNYYVGPQRRTLASSLADGLKNQILSQIPKTKPITVVSIMSDPESEDFAREIHAFLKTNGYNMKEPGGISQGVFSPTPRGLVFRDDDDGGLTFIVGVNQQ